MKILIIRCFASSVNRDSYNLQEEGLAKALIRKGHTCDIVYYNSNNESIVEKVVFDRDLSFNIYWLKAKKISMISIYNKKEIDCLVSKYDLVQVLEYEQLTSWYILKRYTHKAVLYHGPYLSEYSKRYCEKSKIFDFLYGKKLLKRIFAITKSYKAEDYLKLKGVINLKTIGVGLDLSKFSIPQLKPVMKNKDCLNILYVGQLEERRNIKFIIEIVNELKKRNINCLVTLLGTGDESYVSECKKYAKELSVYDKFDFVGKVKQNDLAYYYNISDVFILPTRYEIFGMVLMESMLFGCPVITSENGGSDVLIKNGQNGFIIDNSNVSDWADILYNIELNKRLTNEIRYNAQDTILNNYNWDKLSENFLNVYQNILNLDNKYEND